MEPEEVWSFQVGLSAPRRAPPSPGAPRALDQSFLSFSQSMQRCRGVHAQVHTQTLF